MKNVLFVVICMLFSFGAFAQNTNSADMKNQVEAPPIIETLYVISVENTLENKERLSMYESTLRGKASVVETADKLTLIYQGAQLTSDVEPSFIKSINVLKGAKAESSYPNLVSEGGVMEIELMHDDDLQKVMKSLKAI